MRSPGAKLALFGIGTCLAGCVGGIGLANYTESGAFGFYREAQMAEWAPQADYVAAVETRDLQLAMRDDDGARQTSFEAYSGVH